MMARRHLRGVLFGVVIISLTSGIFAPAGAQLVPVRGGYGGTGGYQLPLWVNREAGLAKKYGIDLEVLLIGAGSLNMQALVGGSIQLSQNSASAAIQAALKGVPVVIIATQESKIPFQIIARPEIKDPSSSEDEESVPPASAAPAILRFRRLSEPGRLTRAT
jgi:ABC-type nitrate/sulfonate/bicarbonate transport system substrate-binding protein